MAAEAAFMELRNQLLRLRVLLKVMRKEARRECPDREHCVVTRIQDAVTDMRGWLRKALAAVRLGLTALQGDGGGSMLRTLLTRFDLHWRSLRRTFNRQIGSACRLNELKELAKSRHLQRSLRRAWSGWVVQVKPTIRSVRKQSCVVTRSIAACWREMAARPAGAGILITNVAIGPQSYVPRDEEARRPGDTERRER